MSTPEQPKQQPTTPSGPTEHPDASNVSQSGPENAEPKGRPTSDRQDSETAAND